MASFALCIGINNYPGTDMDLAGCVNDASDWAAELGARGFAVRTLLDAEATKAAMVAAMREVIAIAIAGDLVAITFSGHGTYVFDTDDSSDGRGDEPDGFDEALCPHDVQASGDPLTDDEIHALFAARASGVRLLLIADSCHSGTVSRAVPGAAGVGPRKRFLPPAHWMKTAQLARALAEPARDFAHTGASAFTLAAGRGGDVTEAAAGGAHNPPLDDVLLAGCQEGKLNFSYDAVFATRPNGAFTFHALKALRGLPPGATYADWHAAITPEFLPTTEYPQTPQMVAIDAAKRRPVLD